MEELFQNLIAAHTTLAPIIFVVLRSLAVIIPPISGIVVDLIGIYTFGWKIGLVYGELGIILGIIVTFYISRIFKEPLVKRFVSLQQINRWEEELSENKRFLYLVLIRFLTSPFFDYVSYVAGLTNIPMGRFVLSSILGTIPWMFATYYFGDVFISMGNYLAVAFIILTIVFGWIFKRMMSKKYNIIDQ